MFNIFKRSPSLPKPQAQSTPTKQSSDQKQEVHNRHNQKCQGNKITEFNYNVNQVKLPENFAEKLLNLELEVESSDLNIQTVTDLLELYREAVEYYEAIQSDKYLIFKNKIHTLVTKKNVVSVMKSGNQQSLSQNQLLKKPPVSQVLTIPKGQKQKELQIRLNFIKSQDQQHSVNSLLNEHNEKEQKLNNLINQEINDQEQVFQKRLQQRRNNSVKKESGKLYVCNENATDPSTPIGPASTSNHAPIVRAQNFGSYSNYQLKNRKKEDI